MKFKKVMSLTKKNIIFSEIKQTLFISKYFYLALKILLYEIRNIVKFDVL